MAVDDAGEFLVVVGTSVAIGHVRARDVDLPFLADVAARHARLDLVEEFHAGARWRIAPVEDARVQVGGRDVGESGHALAHGDEVRLARNLAFRFVAAERGSSAARLELGGSECLGAPRVLLLPPGPGGRARFGSSAARTVALADLTQEIELVADADAIRVRCPAGVGAVARAVRDSEARIALPLSSSVTLVARARAAGRPPFALIFRPADATVDR